MRVGARVILHLIHAQKGGPIKTDPVLAPNGVALSTGGEYAIACDPGRRELHENYRATDATYLVNCPKCMATEIYKKLYEPHPSVSYDAMSPEAREAMDLAVQG